MIAHLNGKITEKTPTFAVIDCAGVGYHVNISLHTYTQIKDLTNTKLLTHLIIREDNHILYGFAQQEERDLFKKLISVSGVGPSTTLLILSSLTVAEVHNAIVEGNVDLLKRVKGIGAKSASRIIVDLKDRLEKEGLILNDKFALPNNTTMEEALSALIALGFDKKQAEKSLERATKELSGDGTVEQLIKVTLKNM